MNRKPIDWKRPKKTFQSITISQSYLHHTNKDLNKTFLKKKDTSGIWRFLKNHILGIIMWKIK